MTKKKSVKKETNKNKNVNKNNINITINHPTKKRTYKKRSSAGNPKQGQLITIINQIPNTQEQLNQPKPLDLTKTAFNYNMPRHKPTEITNEEPRPEKLKRPLQIYAPKDDVKIPSKTLKKDNPMLNKKSSPLVPPTLLSFESQVPLSGFNEMDTEYYPDDGGFLNLTTLKPRREIYSENNFKSFYNPNLDTTFQSQFPTTYDENSDDVPDLEPVFDTHVPTTPEERAKNKEFDRIRGEYIERNVNKNTERINNGIDAQDIADEQRARNTYNNIIKQFKQKDEDNGHEYKNETLPLERVTSLKHTRLTETEISTQPHNKNIAILRPPPKETFESQTPFSEGFHTPEKRRETILPTYKNDNTSFVDTPNVLDQKPKRTRRTKAQMEEARAMDREQLLQKGVVTPNTKLNKKANELLITLKGLNAQANEKDRLRKQLEEDEKQMLRKQSQNRSFTSPVKIKVIKKTESVERYESAVGNLKRIQGELKDLETAGRKASGKKIT